MSLSFLRPLRLSLRYRSKIHLCQGKGHDDGIRRESFLAAPLGSESCHAAGNFGCRRRLYWLFVLDGLRLAYGVPIDTRIDLLRLCTVDATIPRSSLERRDEPHVRVRRILYFRLPGPRIPAGNLDRSAGSCRLGCLRHALPAPLCRDTPRRRAALCRRGFRPCRAPKARRHLCRLRSVRTQKHRSECVLCADTA